MSWSVRDGARDEDGDSCVHGAGSGGAYGMRDDGVGVGDMVTCNACCGNRPPNLPQGQRNQSESRSVYRAVSLNFF
jgi:hypothetical protein